MVQSLVIWTSKYLFTLVNKTQKQTFIDNDTLTRINHMACKKHRFYSEYALFLSLDIIIYCLQNGRFTFRRGHIFLKRIKNDTASPHIIRLTDSVTSTKRFTTYNIFMIDFFPLWENCGAPNLRTGDGKVHAKRYHRCATMVYDGIFASHLCAHAFLTDMIDSYRLIRKKKKKTFWVFEQPFTSENGVALCNVFKVIQQA